MHIQISFMQKIYDIKKCPQKYKRNHSFEDKSTGIEIIDRIKNAIESSDEEESILENNISNDIKVKNLNNFKMYLPTTNLSTTVLTDIEKIVKTAI